jgi:hypothetical protein
MNIMNILLNVEAINVVGGIIVGGTMGIMSRPLVTSL